MWMFIMAEEGMDNAPSAMNNHRIQEIELMRWFVTILLLRNQNGPAGPSSLRCVSHNGSSRRTSRPTTALDPWYG
jgi:hypothetical protein